MAKHEKSLIDSITMKGHKQTETDRAVGEWVISVLTFIGEFFKDIGSCILLGAVKTIKSKGTAYTFKAKLKKWISLKNKNYILLVPFLISVIGCVIGCILVNNKVWSTTNLVTLFVIALPIEYLFIIGVLDKRRLFRNRNLVFLIVCGLDMVFLLTNEKYHYIPSGSIFDNIGFLVLRILIVFSPVIYIGVVAIKMMNEEEKPNQFEEQFREIGLKTSGSTGTVPKLIDIHQLGMSKKIYVFSTIIPVSVFENKRDYLENILQESIIKIKSGNHGIIKIYTGQNDENKIEFESEFSEIGLKTKGENGKVPFLVNSYYEDNLIGNEHFVYEFETLLSKKEFNNRKEELEKFLTGNQDKILGIENNKKIMKVYVGELKQVMLSWKEDYNNIDDTILRIGMDALLKKYIEIDINDRHILLGGSTGSGKSVLLRLLTWLFYLKRYTLYMSDFKDGAEFNQFCRKLGKITTTREGFLKYLIELNKEATKRNKLFAMSATNNINEYNKIVENKKMRLNRICLICDELASPLDVVGADKETKQTVDDIKFNLSELARKGRSAGIHLLLCMQRPDAEILKGQIKNNLLIRICGIVKEETLSKIVLGNTLAVDLPKLNGRMILDSKEYDNQEIQTFYFNLNKELLNHNLIDSKDLESEIEAEEKKKVNINKRPELNKNLLDD